jgi:hypothetical protein
MKHKVGDKVTAFDTSGAPHSTGVIQGVDSTGRFHLVKYDSGGEEYLPPEALKPEFPDGSVEAIDVNGEHWKIIPPAEGQTFWTMACLTKTKAEEKKEAEEKKAGEKEAAAQFAAEEKATLAQDKADAKADAALEKKEAKAK